MFFLNSYHEIFQQNVRNTWIINASIHDLNDGADWLIVWKPYWIQQHGVRECNTSFIIYLLAKPS